MIKLSISYPISEYSEICVKSEKEIVVKTNNPNNTHYSKENLEEYYEKRNKFSFLKLIKTKEGRIFIHFEKLNILFIPLRDRSRKIIDFTFTEYENFEKVSLYTFHRITHPNNNKEYAQSSDARSMHEIIFGRKAKKGYKIDHINSKGLDNRTSNLREITNSHNASNREITFGFRGVSQSNSGTWESRIQIDGKSTYIGTYNSAEESAKIHDIYSVYYHRDENNQPIIPLNKIDGKNILSEEEIKNIIEKGIPEDFLYKGKERELPRNIHKGNKSYYYFIEYTKFFRNEERAEFVMREIIKNDFCNKAQSEKLKIERKGNAYQLHVKMRKSFKTIEETQLKLEEIREYFLNIDKIEKESLINDIDNYRNSKGIAIILAYNGKTEKYEEVEVDDEDWKEFIQFKWYLDNGYPRRSRFEGDGGIRSLHSLIYKKIHPEYSTLTHNETIDHIDTNPNNCKRNNLRLATGREQSQNRKKRITAFFDYTGINLKHSKIFCVLYLGKNSITKGPFKFIEEAAEEYNKLVKEHYNNGRLNVIPDTKTTIEDLFHKDFLSVEMVKNIKSISIIESIFFINNDWRKKNKINLCDLRLKDIEYYKNLLVGHIVEYNKSDRNEGDNESNENNEGDEGDDEDDEDNEGDNEDNEGDNENNESNIDDNKSNGRNIKEIKSSNRIYLKIIR